MTLEKELLAGDVIFGVSHAVNDLRLLHQKHIVPMGEDLHDLLLIHPDDLL